jgi:hypothetical protein
MKKFLVIVLTVVIAVAMISCKGATGPAGADGVDGKDGEDFSAIPSNATILLNENFESYAVGVTPTGWTRGTTFEGGAEVYHSVTNTPFMSYSKSLKIMGFNTYFDREIVKAPGVNDAIPNTLSGKIYLSFYVYKASTSKAKGFTFYINQLEKCRIDFNSDGYIYAYTTMTAKTSIATYSALNWTRVDILLNLSAQNYSVYIDTNKKVENVPCYNSVEQDKTGNPIFLWPSNYSDFFGIFSNIDSAWTDTNSETYIDNVLIYYVP